ncbi:MAG TPA: acetylornithine deacetylase [Gammaproteobacteria bacterium]|nr:acetylornithine deacetylase [Gammaproteobacteria bacterium]
MNHRAPPLRAMLADLIGTPSVSSVNPQFDMGNHDVATLLAGWLEDLGFRVEIQSLPGRPGKYNVIGVLGRGSGGLVLAGHTDTVPCDAYHWSHDPFTLTERDGHFSGLGCADMKAFFALALEAVRRTDPSKLHRPLIVVGTADEESSMSGARALQERDLAAGRYAIIGEPTAMKPVRMHKGIFMEAIRVTGHAGHSSDPRLGLNALDGMHRVMQELMRFREELRERYHDGAFRVPHPTLNFGHIHGGDNPNRICPDCELHIDLRTLPGMSIEAMREELRARVRSALDGSGYSLEFEALFEGVEGLHTAANAALVEAAERLTGHTAGSAVFSTEGAFFQSLGLETLVLGPGCIEQAHQPDESLSLERIEPFVTLLERLIHRFCIEPAPIRAA